MKSKMILGRNAGVFSLFALHPSPDVYIWFAIGALSCIVFAFLPRAVAAHTNRADCLLLKTLFSALSAVCFLIGWIDLYLQETTLSQEFMALGCTLFMAQTLSSKSN